MLERENSVCFLGASLDACSLWRFFMPHFSMPGSGFFCFVQNPSFDVIAGFDVIVVQRCCLRQQFEFIQSAAQHGLKIIYDIDDNVWDLPEYNPAQAILAKYKAGFASCMRMVDLVTVSTRTLAKVVRQNVKFMVNARTGKEIPIVVCENKVEERLFSNPTPRSGPVRVGWEGSSSHAGDFGMVEDAIVSCAQEYPDTVFEFRGLELPSSNLITKLPRFQQKYWMPVSEFCSRMPVWGWDVALAPVTDHVFNASKSGIKMLEAACLGIPCLASWVKPYEEFCFWDKELQWLLCAGASSWKKKLRELVGDAARRQELGSHMRKVMVEHYSFRQTHEGWEQAVQMVRSL